MDSQLMIGCGDGMFGLELIQAGCISYQGLDASQQIVQLAQQNLKDAPGQVIHSKIESWSYPEAHFDLVVSRLALHYVPDLDEIFPKIHRTLKGRGRFIFSIVHPVITSSDKSRTGGGMRQDWIVDDYFTPGLRQVHFNGKFVKQYHRTIEDIYKSLQRANFQVGQLRESRPEKANFTDMDLFERRKRIPLFLFLSGRKK